MIDLETLSDLLGLPEDCIAPLVHRARVALERRHRSGVHLTGIVHGTAIDEELRWRSRSATAATYEDIKRVTEEGTETIGLALACSKSSWRIQRRLQARLAEGADWLMLDPSTGSAIVLEIGGTDEQELEPLLARKIQQARRSPFCERGTPAACVVRFLEPSSRLEVDRAPRRTEP